MVVVPKLDQKRSELGSIALADLSLSHRTLPLLRLYNLSLQRPPNILLRCKVQLGLR